jgi:hypothetical protein
VLDPVPTCRGSPHVESLLFPAGLSVGTPADWSAPRGCRTVEITIALACLAAVTELRLVAGAAGLGRTDAPVVSIACGPTLDTLEACGDWDLADPDGAVARPGTVFRLTMPPGTMGRIVRVGLSIGSGRRRRRRRRQSGGGSDDGKDADAESDADADSDSDSDAVTRGNANVDVKANANGDDEGDDDDDGCSPRIRLAKLRVYGDPMPPGLLPSAVLPALPMSAVPRQRTRVAIRPSWTKTPTEMRVLHVGFPLCEVHGFTFAAASHAFVNAVGSHPRVRVSVLTSESKGPISSHEIVGEFLIPGTDGKQLLHFDFARPHRGNFVIFEALGPLVSRDVSFAKASLFFYQ